ncbi:SET and MYND domain-containing protein 4 isoform X1 [Amblyraja radiata]|uniref:SET and MYND domain-containing protein 4 isoform X1 n=1 Tax=Amblyraja radiata TaxID=386614 RepID=UPI0014040A22|nr:SET and MYND domain-containing protein 4 isoform X1 [Amblyraja radiata]
MAGMQGPGHEWRRRCRLHWRHMPDLQRRRFTSNTRLGPLLRLARRWLRPADTAVLDELCASWRADKDRSTALDLKQRGNDSFKARDYLQALSLYTKGLRYMPADSPECALLYANRSAALYQLHRYQSPQQRFVCAASAAALCWALQHRRPQGDGVGTLGQGARLAALGVAVLRHMLQLQCNAQAITVLHDTGEGAGSVRDTREVCVGTALYCWASLLNHSCQPNTTASFQGTRITLRATEPIPAGEQVLHCYGPHWSRQCVGDRRKSLQTQYYFWCECSACVREGGEGSPAPQAQFLCRPCGSALSLEEGGYRCVRCAQLVPPQSLQQQLQQLRLQMEGAGNMDSTHTDTALAQLQQCQADAQSLLPAQHPLHGEIDDSLARVYATHGEWGAAAQHLQRSVHAVELQYGTGSVELAQQLLKLAQVLFNSRSVCEAESVIDRAIPLLTTHYGADHDTVAELRAMNSCLRSLPGRR